MKEYLKDITDPRQPWKTDHNLHEIIIMTICAVISDFNHWEDIVDFCKVKAEWFKERLGLKLEHGIASHDTFQRIFQIIDPKEMERSFISWVKSIAVKTDGEIVSIDGKTLRRSRNGERNAIHMVSAWANKNQLVLGQVKTDEKSNEITAIPTLLELLD
ncbi:MAG: ISAs1 family transposase, partial [Treponema sp.]|nr:ISAs1 family transposase [Treponema sp.]